MNQKAVTPAPQDSTQSPEPAAPSSPEDAASPTPIDTFEEFDLDNIEVIESKVFA